MDGDVLAQRTGCCPDIRSRDAVCPHHRTLLLETVFLSSGYQESLLKWASSSVLHLRYLLRITIVL